MEQPKITGQYRNKSGHIEMSLLLKGWKDEETGFYFLYSPALDLTGYGETMELASKSLRITLDEFVKYTHKKKTIFDELEQLGWMVNRKKKRVQAPDEEHLMRESKVFRNLQNMMGVSNMEQDFHLQLA